MSGFKINRWLEYVAVLAVLVGFANFFWFFAESVTRFGSGDALADGSIVAGNYYIYEKAHGGIVEVSRADWDWSRLHAASVWFLTFPLTIASMLYLNCSPDRRARFRDPFSRSRTTPASSDHVTGEPGARPDALISVASLFGLAVSLAMVGLGFVWAIPTLGVFGWIWTGVGALILVVNARRFLSWRRRSQSAPVFGSGARAAFVPRQPEMRHALGTQTARTVIPDVCPIGRHRPIDIRGRQASQGQYTRTRCRWLRLH